MPPRPTRRFKIRDILVLTAAVALGLAWMRCFKDTEAGGESYPYLEDMPPRPHALYGLKVVEWWMTCLSYVMAPVAIALAGLIAWGTPHRRRWRTATRRPGAVAGGVVLLTVALDLVTATCEVIKGMTSGDRYDSIWQFSYLTLSNDHAAIAVAAAWSLLALSGRWLREPGWLDALGTALGLFWLVLFGLNWGLHNLPHWGVLLAPLL